MITQLNYEISEISTKLYSIFKTKSYLKGLYVNLNIIRDVLNIYVIGLSNKRFRSFRSGDGELVKDIVNYIYSRASYDKEVIYFILYELELLAKKGNMLAQKILNYDSVENVNNFKFPFVNIVKAGFLSDLKSTLFYLLLILVFVYFAPFLRDIIKNK
ncbi:MAG: hypothetical protein RMJ67_06020 [Elusimicrobiota bacterium]|nr:hypothetical protein [Endomicrobiia bacterium]MDW8166049.1 hypothetical protein [Elusimicrobiota bacterium]